MRSLAKPFIVIAIFIGLAPALETRAVTSTISASRTNINAGESIILTWQCSTGATNGDIFIQSGSPQNLDLAVGLGGSISSGPLSESKLFQANCLDPDDHWIVSTVAVNVTPAIGTNSGTTTQTSTLTNAAINIGTLNTSVRTTIDTQEIEGAALKLGGGQAWAIDAANKASDTGAGKAASAGALYCAQGANAIYSILPPPRNSMRAA